MPDTGDSIRESGAREEGVGRVIRGHAGLSDLIVFAAILLLSVVAGRSERSLFDPDYVYPTTLLNIFATVAQAGAVLLAIGVYLFHRLERAAPSVVRRSIVRALLLICVVLLLDLALMPFAEVIYDVKALRQGVAIGVVLLAGWSVAALALAIVRVVGKGERERGREGKGVRDESAPSE
jgi:hypothetical protein